MILSPSLPSSHQCGWVYGSVTEDIVTGYLLHVRGWRSVYCMPARPAFKVWPRSPCSFFCSPHSVCSVRFSLLACQPTFISILTCSWQDGSSILKALTHSFVPQGSDVRPLRPCHIIVPHHSVTFPISLRPLPISIAPLPFTSSPLPLVLIPLQGSAPINLTDRLAQVLRWVQGMQR